ncbi:DegT/DnrJ/EryC1/StrS family aminotransferase [Iamia majanohamensis]|uniref:DegT/DnrJ/EryC1/StrS family aminotransferase n=1 Tax=Iamia majanohamensis TaxID=467976 RepID=A0AAE9Y7I1_9ACTN|nr:DegT/DnrJ/EryC1/StrS family aminotransferase [Iamia majanohamensis]WCO65853.1 DegT/DnrJ/EryC1/StrS family aminotransferase [Iamia majanohamensis]
MTAPGGYDPLASVGPGAPDPSRGPRIRLARPQVGEAELDAVRDVLESGFLTNGPWTRRFEERFAGRHEVAHAVAFANGTVALEALLRAHDVGPGDEVVVPSFTFISTATSVLHVGATPVFADIDPHTFDLDPAAVARVLTPRTRAVVPVHYGGQPAALAELCALAEDAGIVLLEDAAEAHGARCEGRPVGSWGHAGMFSFTPTKNITTGEGGMVTTDDGALAQRLRLLRNHGMDAPYHHASLGWNWRLSDIHAAIGCCQLDRLDDILATKRANAAVMAELLAPLPGVVAPVVAPGRDHTFMLYTVRVPPNRRDAALAGLAARGIEARVYFPPAHRQPVFAHLPVPDLPTTDEVAASVLSLPFHAGLGHDDLAEVATALEAALAGGATR